MSNFPDLSVCEVGKITDVDGNQYIMDIDKNGYILYGHDRQGGDGQDDLINYVAMQTSSKWYTVDTQGKVTQHDSP
jgi:hypothetical protein